MELGVGARAQHEFGRNPNLVAPGLPKVPHIRSALCCFSALPFKDQGARQRQKLRPYA
jgi:hypothetical protein